MIIVGIFPLEKTNALVPCLTQGIRNSCSTNKKKQSNVSCFCWTNSTWILVPRCASAPAVPYAQPEQSPQQPSCATAENLLNLLSRPPHRPLLLSASFKMNPRWTLSFPSSSGPSAARGLPAGESEMNSASQMHGSSDKMLPTNA